MTLPPATPGARNVDPAAVDAFVEAVEREKLGVHALAIARHGRLEASVAWNPYRLDVPHIMFSVSKSFSSTAIGIAQDEGLLDIDEPAIDFFPEHATAAAVANTKGLLLRHVLSMATGHEVDTMTLMRALPSHDWVRIFLESPIVYPPGTRFLYNSGASYFLSAVIKQRTGQSLSDYLAPRLFEPLGIADPAWQRGPTGLELGASGLRLTPHDMLSFGQLYLDRGLWQGRRLLSERWVDLVAQPHVASHPGDDDWAQGYGFQFWRSRHGSFRADGAYGQFILILPEQDAVVAITSGSARTHEIVEAVWDHLLPDLRDDAPASAASAPLDSVRSLPGEQLRPARLDEVIAAGEHPLPFLRLGAVALRADDGALVLRHRDGQEERHPIGLGDEWGPESVTALWPHEEMTQIRMRSRGGFLEDGRFRIVQQCIETPFARVWTFTPDGERLRAEVGLDHGFWAPGTESFTLAAR